MSRRKLVLKCTNGVASDFLYGCFNRCAGIFLQNKLLNTSSSFKVGNRKRLVCIEKAYPVMEKILDLSDILKRNEAATNKNPFSATQSRDRSAKTANVGKKARLALCNSLCACRWLKSP